MPPAPSGATISYEPRRVPAATLTTLAIVPDDEFVRHARVSTSPVVLVIILTVNGVPVRVFVASGTACGLV
jgi:hypothetical protein